MLRSTAKDIALRSAVGAFLLATFTAYIGVSHEGTWCEAYDPLGAPINLPFGECTAQFLGIYATLFIAYAVPMAMLDTVICGIIAVFRRARG